MRVDTHSTTHHRIGRYEDIEIVQVSFDFLRKRS